MLYRIAMLLAIVASDFFNVFCVVAVKAFLASRGAVFMFLKLLSSKRCFYGAWR